MTTFLNKKKRENDPKGFAAWMRQSGTQMQNSITPDDAAATRARSAPTHGIHAEKLYEKGLSSSGYASFLADEAERAFKSAKQKYAQDSASNL